jgi:hypothetical protein
MLEFLFLPAMSRLERLVWCSSIQKAIEGGLMMSNRSQQLSVQMHHHDLISTTQEQILLSSYSSRLWAVRYIERIKIFCSITTYVSNVAGLSAGIPEGGRISKTGPFLSKMAFWWLKNILSVKFVLCSALHTFWVNNLTYWTSGGGGGMHYAPPALGLSRTASTILTTHSFFSHIWRNWRKFFAVCDRFGP